VRIERFYIGRYRVLEDLEIKFERVPQPLLAEQSYALDFLVGVNGTGKSTVLRLLGRLFFRLRQESGPAYRFQIPLSIRYSTHDESKTVCYEFSNLKHEIDENDSASLEDPSNKIYPALHYRERVKENEQEWGDWSNWRNGEEGPLGKDKLPNLVVYSSGSLTEWRKILLETRLSGSASDQPEENAEADHFEWPNHKVDRRRPEPIEGLTFIEPSHLPLVALCGLLADRWEDKSQNKLKYVFEEAHLEKLLGFSLRIRYFEDLHPEEVRRVRNNLAKIASRVVKQGADWLLVFDHLPDLVGSESFFGELFARPMQMFEELFDLARDRDQIDTPLRGVNLFFEKQKAKDLNNEQPKPMLHMFSWMSDGEQSLLARMSLFSLFREDNYLILLDEPEVHFNDVWKREIIKILDQVMEGKRSHTLITTHSSITLTDVPRQAVTVLERHGEFTSDAHPAGIETLGADPSDILVHVFNAPSASGERGVSYLQKKLGESRGVEQLDELLKITAPGYWRYRIQLERQRITRGS
jgi:predicted ATPase